MEHLSADAREKLENKIMEAVSEILEDISENEEITVNDSVSQVSQKIFQWLAPFKFELQTFCNWRGENSRSTSETEVCKEKQ